MILQFSLSLPQWSGGPCISDGIAARWKGLADLRCCIKSWDFTINLLLHQNLLWPNACRKEGANRFLSFSQADMTQQSRSQTLESWRSGFKSQLYHFHFKTLLSLSFFYKMRVEWNNACHTFNSLLGDGELSLNVSFDAGLLGMSVGFRSNVRALQISFSISRINDKP